MFSAPPDAASCTHRCHRLRTTSHADSVSFLHIQPAQPPSPQPNSSTLPLTILAPVARTGLPQLGPSLLPEPPHSSICRTPLPSASMASHMHHMSTIYHTRPPSLFVWHPTHAAYSPQRSPISLSTTASPRTWIIILPLLLPPSQSPSSTSKLNPSHFQL